MTTTEALALLDGAVADDRPSRVNKTMTRRQAVDIMRASVAGGIFDQPDFGREITKRLIEKNVRRVAADR